MNFSAVTCVLPATPTDTLLTQYSFHVYMAIKHVNLFKGLIKYIYLKLCFPGFWQRGGLCGITPTFRRNPGTNLLSYKVINMAVAAWKPIGTYLVTMV